MTVTTFVVVVVVVLAAAVVGLGLQTLSLRRQVRELGMQVVGASPVTSDRAAAVEQPAPPASPAQPASLSVEAPPELVLTPMPLAAEEAEPELPVARVASVTLGEPLIKLAAFSHGVRRAIGEDGRLRVGFAFRKELRRQRRMRRRRRPSPGPSRETGWTG